MLGRYDALYFEKDERYIPVIAFFEYILDNDFEAYMRELAEEKRIKADDTEVCFPSNVDSESDTDYFSNGVKFSFAIEKNFIFKKIISNEEYVKSVELACRVYYDEHAKNENIDNYLSIIKRRYL